MTKLLRAVWISTAFIVGVGIGYVAGTQSVIATTVPDESGGTDSLLGNGIYADDLSGVTAALEAQGREVAALRAEVARLSGQKGEHHGD